MKIIKRVLFAVIIIGIISCSDLPMGMGDPIDFEPPVLTLDPVGHPYYAKKDAKLSGTVKDNIKVDRVILRDTESGDILFRAVLLPDDRWEMALEFTEEDNTKQIIAEIVAYDNRDNSGDESIAAITIIVDIGEPVVKDIIIQRTATRTMDLVDYNELKKLETEDPNRERSENADKYQNGRFYINAFLEENETRIEKLELKIYDIQNPDDPHDDALILEPAIETGNSFYAPKWLIDEKDLLDSGVSIFGASYRDNYLNGARYYYRVVVTAYDRSENRNIVEEQGFFCLWDKSDNPVGIVDAKAVGETNPVTVTSGSSIPVIFFDDDKLGKAYSGLLTLEQWAGTKEIYTGVSIPAGTDLQKQEFLRNRLFAGDPVYNWRFDKYNGTYNTDPTHKDYNITEQVGTNDLEELIYYVQTGNSSEDHGTYILFTVSQDKKIDPNDKSPAYPARDGMFKYTVNVIDENAPLIVFDTDAGSPEENTFPKLVNGEHFTIQGYTLRENKSGINRVTTFRMAWIPARTPGGPDSLITDVQKALAGEAAYPEGVQHWDFSYQFDNLTDWEEDDIGGGNMFRRQNFKKTFNILGKDELYHGEPAFTQYKFFHSVCDGTNGAGEPCTLTPDANGMCRENATKLFVVYAKDNVGHEVYRQLRLLGNRTPPSLSAFDLTPISIALPENVSGMPYGIDTPGSPGGIVNTIPSVFYYTTTGEFSNDKYIEARNIYNNASYTPIRNGFIDIPYGSRDNYRSVPLRNYPRGSTVKFWVTASMDGDLFIDNIKMYDITDTTRVELGVFNSANNALSYVEYFPEVTQRSFLIEATDTLGNVARMQRTVAISSRARLVSITTNEQDGTYPAGKEIEIRANFDGLIKLANDNNRPRLNIKFGNSDTILSSSLQPNAVRVGKVIQIPCEPLNGGTALSLVFKFIVPHLASGKLETMYEGFTDGVAGSSTDRPIWLSGNNTELILDANQNDPAFTPTNTIGFHWLSADGSLQESKNIQLDGTPPSITGMRSDVGKAAAPTGGSITAGSYYFKSGESLYITLIADEDIKTRGTPTLEYEITRRDNGQVWNNMANGKSEAFIYQRPGDTTKEMVFRLDINRDNIPYDGELTSIRLVNENPPSITDIIGNSVISSTVTASAFAGYRTAAGINKIYFDLTPPPRPETSRTYGTTPATAVITHESTNSLNAVQRITIADCPVSNTNQIHAGEPISKEISIDGGLSWNPYSSSGVDIPAGTATTYNNKVMTRYVDTAGNIGAVFESTFNININFPILNSVTLVNPIGTYTTRTTTPTLTFRLNFAEPVSVGTRQANVTITLRNRKASNTNNTSGTNPSYEHTIQAADNQNNVTSVDFPWTLNANTKEMIDGLYISAINITGLLDSFGNPGPAVVIDSFNDTTHAASSPQIKVGSQTAINNLNRGIIVDTIAPKLSNNTSGPIVNSAPRVPAHEGISADNKTITIRFNEPVMVGSGTITIRPRGAYAIPAVFVDQGYTDSDGAYVDSLYDVYNALSDTTHRGYLVRGSWSNPEENPRTGHNAGPYIKKTHGLKEGLGYTGNYNNATGANGPNPTAGYMIPDLATKWVLDFQYGIHDTNTTVTNIRVALNNAKFRWQEIEVVNTSINGNEVTITLNRTLHKGLQWDVHYPQGTFTDLAGNPAPGAGQANANGTANSNSDYWFWSSGVQPPVIRVNRRSYDARTVGTTTLNDLSPDSSRVYSNPADTANWNTPGFAVTDFTGWGIGNFNYVHYRVESESPGAQLQVGEYKGTAANNGSAFADWTGSVSAANGNKTAINAANWEAAASNTAGQWILSNIIRRSRDGGSVSYTATTQKGTPETRIFDGTYRGFKSYNRDLTKTELDAVVKTSQSNGYRGGMTFSALEASKSYVSATATVNSQTPVFGYEGIFRTLVVLSDTATSTTMTIVEGSNVKNGTPNICDFPVRSGGSGFDNRLVKVMYLAGTNRLYWVSTEIVCEWYFQRVGRSFDASGNISNGSNQEGGDVNNHSLAGYGDLTYSYASRAYGN